MFVVLDIGGTKMRLANSFDGSTLNEVVRFPTPNNFKNGLQIIGEFLAKSNLGEIGDKICVGVPGILDSKKTKLIKAPHLNNWEMRPLKEELEKLSKVKVYLENDSALASLGESIKGAGQGKNIVAFITIGTGVGGARVVNGRIDVAAFGFEPGHQILDVDGTISNNQTTLDTLIGGAGMEMRFGMKRENIDDAKIWEEVEKLLAAGLVNTVLHWSPETVVLGGSLMQSEHISIKNIKEKMSGFLKVFPILPDVVSGLLGDEAGLIGGLEFLKQQE